MPRWWVATRCATRWPAARTPSSASPAAVREWYRPPRGEVTSATLLAARETGHTVALWSVARDDHGELADDDAAGVGRHLRGALQPGDVVDLHDGIGRSSFTGLSTAADDPSAGELAALPDVLRAWIDQVRPSVASPTSSPRLTTAPALTLVPLHRSIHSHSWIHPT